MTADDMKAVRTRLGLSHTQMAALLGITARTYYRYESGDKIPLTVQKLVFTLLKSPSVLLAEIERVKSMTTPDALIEVAEAATDVIMNAKFSPVGRMRVLADKVEALTQEPQQERSE